jgi:hypothetical protein
MSRWPDPSREIIPAIRGIDLTLKGRLFYPEELRLNHSRLTANLASSALVFPKPPTIQKGK